MLTRLSCTVEEMGLALDDVVILLACNEYFVPYTAVAIQSIIEHMSPERHYDIVVLTRDRDYVKGLGNEGLVLRSHRYDAYPYFTHALETRYLRYNARRDLLFAMEAERDPRVLVIAPPDPVDVDVTGADGGALLSLYVKGRQQAEARLEEIAAFIGHEA